MCTKLSGQAAQFSKKEKFDSIVRFLSARWVLALALSFHLSLALSVFGLFPLSLALSFSLSRQVLQLTNSELGNLSRCVDSSWFEHFSPREHMKMDECMVEIKNQEAQHLKVTLFAREDTKCNTISFPDMDCKRRQWCRGWMGELVHWWGRPHSFINNETTLTGIEDNF